MSIARSSGTRAGGVAAEQHRALAGVLSVPPRPVPDEEEREAFVLEIDSVVHVCPAQTRLRSWLALGRFRDGLPDSLLHAFVPPLALERADADHARWGGEQAGAPLRILTATWSVPLPWFVPFVPADRLVDLTGPYPAVVHRTRMSAARRRVVERFDRRSIWQALVGEYRALLAPALPARAPAAGASPAGPPRLRSGSWPSCACPGSPGPNPGPISPSGNARS